MCGLIHVLWVNPCVVWINPRCVDQSMRCVYQSTLCGSIHTLSEATTKINIIVISIYHIIDRGKHGCNSLSYTLY